MYQRYQTLLGSQQSPILGAKLEWNQLSHHIVLYLLSSYFKILKNSLVWFQESSMLKLTSVWNSIQCLVGNDVWKMKTSCQFLCVRKILLNFSVLKVTLQSLMCISLSICKTPQTAKNHPSSFILRFAICKVFGLLNKYSQLLLA